jgi:hypothetical protein
MDNVFIERLWRSLKHEDVYLKGYSDGREAKAGIDTASTGPVHRVHFTSSPLALKTVAPQRSGADCLRPHAYWHTSQNPGRDSTAAVVPPPVVKPLMMNIRPNLLVAAAAST